MKGLTDKLEKMEAVGKEIEDQTGHKWLQYVCTEPEYILTMYHKPMFEAMANLCSGNGEIGVDCAAVYEDTTFNLGPFLINVKSVKDNIRFNETVNIPFEFVLHFKDSDAAHDVTWKANVEDIPSCKNIRLVEGDLAENQKKVLKRHLPNTFRATCHGHGRGAVKQACKPNITTSISRPFYLSEFKKMQRMTKGEFLVHCKAIEEGNTKWNPKMTQWFLSKRCLVRKALLKDMRNECLIEVGFQPDLEGQVDFDGNAAEGSNNGVKSTIRALLGVFQKRAVSPHRFLWACWVYTHALYNRLSLTLRGELNEFGGLKDPKWAIPSGQFDTGSSTLLEGFSVADMEDSMSWAHLLDKYANEHLRTQRVGVELADAVPDSDSELEEQDADGEYEPGIPTIVYTEPCIPTIVYTAVGNA